MALEGVHNPTHHDRFDRFDRSLTHLVGRSWRGRMSRMQRIRTTDRDVSNVEFI